MWNVTDRSPWHNTCMIHFLFVVDNDQQRWKCLWWLNRCLVTRQQGNWLSRAGDGVSSMTWPSLSSHYPVACRQNGIGIGSMCARTGGVLAPMMYLLRSISPQAPMVLCGLCPLLGSALTLLLPETANKPLPDTIEDVEGWSLRFGIHPLLDQCFNISEQSWPAVYRYSDIVFYRTLI